MKKFISQFIFVLILLSSVFAQNAEQKPKLIDEFNYVVTADWFNRFFSIGQEYQKTDSHIIIKITGTVKDSNYSYKHTLGQRMKAHFVGNMNFDSKRIHIQNCDLENEPALFQIYVIQPDYDIPNCNDKIITPQDTTLFSVSPYDNPYIQMDEIYTTPDLEGNISKTYYKILNELLEKSPESKIYLVGYLGSNPQYGSILNDKGEYDSYEIRKPDKLKMLKKIIKENRNILIKNGVHSSRISTINGGYKDSTRRVEIWIVPKGGEIPKPKPDFFPNNKK